MTLWLVNVLIHNHGGSYFLIEENSFSVFDLSKKYFDMLMSGCGPIGGAFQ